MTTISRTLAAATEGVRLWPRWLVLSAAAVAFVLLLGLPTIIIPFATDQVWFALGARTILDGDQLYRDYWDQKPPLIYLLYAVPFALFGEHMEAVRVMDLANTVLAMGAIFLLTRRFFSERAGIFAAGFYGFTYLTSAGFDGLAETESFMALPLALAFYLYRPRDDRKDAVFLAVASGLLLGIAFAFKTTAILFVFGLPLAEVLLREGPWTPGGAARRLAFAAVGFLVVQAALAEYLAAVGALDDFIDIQRNYTFPYNTFRWEPEGLEPHPRFLIQTTAEWFKDTSYLAVPALGAVLVALFRPRDAARVYFLGALALLGLLGMWWQGKMFHYHWLIMIPLLAPLAGYALDQAAQVFSRLAWRQALSAWALVACGLIALAFGELIATYDSYRAFMSYADGSITRREVEARYSFHLPMNHELVDYVRANSNEEDRLFIWGLWPITYFWLDRPLVDRFVVNSGLRATWAPESWRRELMDDLTADPPRYFAVGRNDVQPWLVGTAQTSEEHLRDGFPELRRFLEQNYRVVLDLPLFIVYERGAVAVERQPR
jgi:4-amino-4-deoxy-L-arabinose transferase-like glycosyltransferase